MRCSILGYSNQIYKSTDYSTVRTSLTGQLLPLLLENEIILLDLLRRFLLNICSQQVVIIGPKKNEREPADRLNVRITIHMPPEREPTAGSRVDSNQGNRPSNRPPSALVLLLWGVQLDTENHQLVVEPLQILTAYRYR
jgi:hypothetical protein